MKLKTAFTTAILAAIATLSLTLSRMQAQAQQHPETAHTHGAVTLHNRAPRPHIHESQPHH